MKRLDKENTIRLIAVIIFLLVATGVTILAIPYVKLLSTDDGLAAVKEKVQDAGILGILFFIGLTIIQVIIAFIPGGPVEILAGMLFNTPVGTALCTLGFFIGTVCVYFMVKKVGKPLVNAFVSEEHFKKFKFLQNEEKLELITFILFLIPGIPKDTLTYFIPLTKINGKKFCVISTLARVPSTISSVMIGSSIQNKNITMGIAAFVIIALLGVLGIIYNNHKNKKDSIKKTISTKSKNIN